MFINFSNHPSGIWEEAQKQAAEQLGGWIYDIAFPEIAPDMTEQALDALVEKYYALILRSMERDSSTAMPSRPSFEKRQSGQTAVMVQGEYTFVYRLVKRLESAGIPCYAACSRRIVQESKQEDGSIVKQSLFHFVQFRSYY